MEHYNIYQLGYNRETGTYVKEIKIRTGNYYQSHTIEEVEGTNSKRCTACGGHMEYEDAYDADGNRISYSKSYDYQVFTRTGVTYIGLSRIGTYTCEYNQAGSMVHSYETRSEAQREGTTSNFTDEYWY